MTGDQFQGGAGISFMQWSRPDLRTTKPNTQGVPRSFMVQLHTDHYSCKLFKVASICLDTFSDPCDQGRCKHSRICCFMHLAALKIPEAVFTHIQVACIQIWLSRNPHTVIKRVPITWPWKLIRCNGKSDQSVRGSIMLAVHLTSYSYSDVLLKALAARVAKRETLQKLYCPVITSQTHHATCLRTSAVDSYLRLFHVGYHKSRNGSFFW